MYKKNDVVKILSMKPFWNDGDKLCTVKDNITNLKEEILARASKWQGRHLKEVHFAMGYACRVDFPELSLEELLKIADEKMYEDKKRYYEALELYQHNKAGN